MPSLPWRFTPKHYLLIGVGVAALVGVMLFYRQIDIVAVHRKAAALNGFWVFVAIVVLPLFGFPISVVHAAAGLRFGMGRGCALVGLATLLQLLAAYGIVRLAPVFFAKKLEPWRKRLPAGTHRSLTVFTMLLPGVPYFVQIYVLPLAGVPLVPFLLWSLPINFARSVAGVLFGDIADHMTPLRFAGFVAYFTVVTVLCSCAFRSLRRKMREKDDTLGKPTPLSEPVDGWEQFLNKRREARRERTGSRR